MPPLRLCLCLCWSACASFLWALDARAQSPMALETTLAEQPFSWASLESSLHRPVALTLTQQGAPTSAPNEGPKHIRDNAFLVEEAFNQEPGEVQHVFNWILLWDSPAGSRTREFLHTYTMEIPLGSQLHQFSFTTQLLASFENPSGGPATLTGGVGDTFLNYRYQLLSDDDFLWAAPRASLILPTGDSRFGLGSGELGYQFNLPISRYGDVFDFHFNVGGTHVSGVGTPTPILGQGEQDLTGYNLGGSVFWKPNVNLNYFVEWLALWNEELDDAGAVDHATQVFVNPGFRCAVCQFDQVEWVLGLSVPVGLTPDTPEIGVFAYMSVEHQFRKVCGCR